MLPSIGIVFLCKYSILIGLYNNNTIIVASQRDCNNNCIKATVIVLMSQTLTVQFHGNVIKAMQVT